MAESDIGADDLVWLFRDSPSPLYVLDDRRRIVFCNPACASWVGVQIAELIGVVCDYHTPPETGGPQAIAAGLCPPPRVFSGQRQSGLVSRSLPEGGTVFRRGHFFPLADGADESAPVACILESVDCPAPEADDNGSVDGPIDDATLHEQVRRFRRRMAARFGVDSLIGPSAEMTRVRAQVELAAQSSAHVLIVGPRGVGKDHVARAIHYARSDAGALAPLSCAALEGNLLRSSLRAIWARQSALEQPNTTLLLAQIEQLPDEVQADLVEMLRGGSLRVRVVATSAVLPRELVAQGRLSRELACALATLTIELPALAERPADLPLLAQALLEQCNVRGSKQLAGFAPEALERLALYAWPGNIAELVEVVHQAYDRAVRGEIMAVDLPERIAWAVEAAVHPRQVDETIVLEEFLSQVEKELILRALRRSKQNKSKAAKLLGLNRPRLYRRLVQLGLEPPGPEPS